MVHYLRTSPPVGPESISAYPSRLRANRSNPYIQPGGYNSLASGLASFDTRNCTSGANAIFPPKAATVADAAFANWVRYPVGSTELGEFYDKLRAFTFADRSGAAGIPAPSCSKQAPYQSIGGTSIESTDYLHVRELPQP